MLHAHSPLLSTPPWLIMGMAFKMHCPMAGLSLSNPHPLTELSWGRNICCDELQCPREPAWRFRNLLNFPNQPTPSRRVGQKGSQVPLLARGIVEQILRCVELSDGGLTVGEVQMASICPAWSLSNTNNQAVQCRAIAVSSSCCRLAMVISNAMP